MVLTEISKENFEVNWIIFTMFVHYFVREPSYPVPSDAGDNLQGNSPHSIQTREEHNGNAMSTCS